MRRKPGDVRDTFADIDVLVRDVSYKPQTSIEEDIRRIVDWYKDFYKVSV